MKKSCVLCSADQILFEIAALLDKAGADFNVEMVKQKGLKPIHLAAMYENLELAKFFLEKGA